METEQKFTIHHLESEQELVQGEKAPPRRRPGGRSAKVRAQVFEAALQLFVTRGFEGVSIAEIASQAGVNETSIYRRWGSREALLVEAALERSELAIPLPDTGSLRGDLAELLRSAIRYLHTPFGRALAQMSAAVSHSDESTAAIQSFWQQRFTNLEVLFKRAEARGEIVLMNHGLLLEMLIGPLYLRLLLTGDPLEEELAEQLVGALLEKNL